MHKLKLELRFAYRQLKGVAMIWIMLISVMMAACLTIAIHPSFWMIAVAASPLVLLSFWKKRTLKSTQTIFSVVYSLTLGCLAVSTANNARASLEFCNDFSQTAYFCIYFAVVAVWSTITSAVCSRFFKHSYPSFSLCTICLVAFACIPQRTQATCAVGFALLLVASTSLLTSIKVQCKKLKEASELLEVKNVAVQLLLKNLGFVLFVVNCFVLSTNAFCTPDGLFTARLCSNIVCAVLATVLTFTYLRQPMDSVAESKMNAIQNKCFDVEKAKQQLYDRLNDTQNYPLPAFLKRLFVHVFRCKFVGAEKITDETACFVANHYEIYGPFTCALHFPYPSCIWTEAAMTDETTIAKHMQRGIDILTEKWLARPIRQAIPRIVAKPLSKCINYTRPIPVYHLHRDKIDNMFNQSVTALTTGDNLIVFPEKPKTGNTYNIGGIDRLQTGFVEIAERYYQTTGKELAFYPLYVDKKGNKMTVGDKVVYNHNCENPREEKLRVTQELFARLNDEAQKGKTVKKRNKKH